MLILSQNYIFFGHNVVNFSVWFLQLTVFKYFVASHVTEPGSLLTEQGAVIKFSHYCSHPGTCMLWYLLRDYNIDILNYFSHVHTAQFVHMMSSSGFLPLTIRPTRVTATSATLIDNIFTNKLMDISHSLQGLFITGVSDHFPIFHVSRRMQMSDVDVYMYKRLFSLNNKEFYHAVSNTNWVEIDRATDTQQAFDLFHNQLTELHNKHFPKVRIKKKYSNIKLWLSEGLKNSIRHKNKLYVKCKKVKSAFSEKLYKTYKRKLQQLMKVAEKHYYHDLIVKNRNDMKKSWGIIKNIINKNQKPQTQSRFKIGNNLITSDKNIICNKFNDFFVNIGPRWLDQNQKLIKVLSATWQIVWLNIYTWNQLLKKKLIHW